MKQTLDTTSDTAAAAPECFDTVRLALATPADIEQIEAWAGDDAWQPSHGGTAMLLSINPQGLFVGSIGERPVSAVSVADHGHDLAFCGTLLVDPELRGRGIGALTWQAAIGRAGDRTLAADVPTHLTEKARRLGFTDGFKILRHAGPLPPARGTDPHVIQLNAEKHSGQLARLDAACFVAQRPGFATTFATRTGHHTLVYADANGNVRGYGTMRPAPGTARIGPLYAERSYQAAALFDALCTLAGNAGALTVSMNVPEQSTPGMAIAETRGLSICGQAHRMYRTGTTELNPVAFDQLCAITGVGLG